VDATLNAFIVTCEHGFNRIPTPYRRLFREQRGLLVSHRGFDPGALVMATTLANACHAPFVASTTSRLLVDLNRSIGHPQSFRRRRVVRRPRCGPKSSNSITGPIACRSNVLSGKRCRAAIA
jgi:predicted N-formylglutamate amidohydrolase